MKTYIQPGNTMTVVAGAAIDSGLPQKVGNLVGIASGEAASGEEYELSLEDAVYKLPKASATTFAQGVKVGWDATGKLCVAAGAGTYDIGHAHKAGLNGETVLMVKLESRIDTVV